MSSSPIEYLRHMLAEADYIVEQSADLERDEFLADETLKRAFVRSIEIIGDMRQCSCVGRLNSESTFECARNLPMQCARSRLLA